MLVTILKKKWNLRFTTNLKNLGDCDSPSETNKGIRICSKLKGEKQLEIILHECLHASDWHKDEEFIIEQSRDLARILWRLGYRKKDDSP